MSNEIEESTKVALDFEKLSKITKQNIAAIPAIAQDVNTGQILMQGFATREALEHSLKTRKATFFSTSRNELWVKGATSGDYLELVEVLVNCEQNSLLYKVRPLGQGVCHTKNKSGQARASCYYRKLDTHNYVFLEP